MAACSHLCLVLLRLSSSSDQIPISELFSWPTFGGPPRMSAWRQVVICSDLASIQDLGLQPAVCHKRATTFSWFR